jgi:hypothetical protein
LTPAALGLAVCVAGLVVACASLRPASDRAPDGDACAPYACVETDSSDPQDATGETASTDGGYEGGSPKNDGAAAREAGGTDAGAGACILDQPSLDDCILQ